MYFSLGILSQRREMKMINHHALREIKTQILLVRREFPYYGFCALSYVFFPIFLKALYLGDSERSPKDLSSKPKTNPTTGYDYLTVMKMCFWKRNNSEKNVCVKTLAFRRFQYFLKLFY